MNARIEALALTDPTVWPDDVLEALRIAVLEEQGRRRAVESAPVLAERLSRELINASGDKEGDEWHEMPWVGYPQNWTVRKGGKLWRSMTPNNVWEPGVAGWREVVEGGRVPPFRKPTGSHDAYRVGERVSFAGSIYAAVLDYVVHSPLEHPGSWRLAPDEQPVEAVTDTPNSLAAWVPSGKAYVVGDRFTYAGRTYSVRQNHTSQAHFTPDAVLSLYLPE